MGKEWVDVLSPGVNKLLQEMVGEVITPESFHKVMKTVREELTIPEQIEFLLIQVVFSKGIVK